MTQSQRRDVLKAAGTVAVIGGLAGCAEGEEPVEDQEGETTPEETQQEPDDDVGAFRVAHASPDAPNVDIYFDDQAVIEDLGFREVSPYEEIEPGSYQVQVTAADDPDAVVFDEEVEVEGGVTNTAVAYGEAAGGPENEFTVEVLEDDITDPGEDTSRVRLFHASPDAEDVDIVVGEAPEDAEAEEPDEEEAPEEEPPDQEPGEDEPEQTQQDEEPPEDEPAPDEEEPEDEEMPDDEPAPDEEDEPAEAPQVGEPLFEGVGFGDSDTQEVPAGDYTLEVVPAGEAPEDEEPEEDEEPAPDEEEAPEDDEPAPEDEEPETQQQEEEEPPADEEPAPDEDEEAPEDEEPVDEFELSTESQTVYSAFAVGYVGEPEDEEPEDEEPEEDENGLLQNSEDQADEEFEVIIVEDAQEGERADGGTDGNGLLTLTH